jgi:hypothetical protein
LEGEHIGKRCGRVNIVQILCTQVCNGKIIPVESVPGMRGEWIKKKSGMGEFKYDLFNIM